MCMEVERNQENQKKSEDRIISYIKKIFEQEENFYKPVRIGNFYGKNYIKYEGNGDTNKTILEQTS